MTDDDALAELVRARGAAWWRIAWLLVGDAQRAEDLVQTALSKTYPKLAELGQASFEAYLRTTMVRTYISWWRRAWRREVPSEHIETPGTAPTDSLDLVRALASLPRAQRAVVVLRYVDDLSVAEVADVLGISQGTVKSHTSRALATLRTSPHLAPAEDGS